MATYSRTPFAWAYLAVQAAAIGAWWAALLAVPALRRPFLPDGAGDADLLAFALPDLALALPASLLAAVLLGRGQRWGVALAWAAAGTMAYAAAYTIAWSMLRGGGWLSVLLMVPAAGCTTLAAIDASRGWLTLFRPARSAPATANLAKTACQIVLFWGFFLFVVPAFVVGIESRVGGPEFAFAGQRIVAALLFLAASALGIWAGAAMARRGEGTPLPMDAPRRLVVTGPYARIRNPMVVAGLGQGLAVAVWLGSPLVLAYVAAGALVWQFLVRPAEEDDMLARFGPKYEEYRRTVRCWVPRQRAEPTT